MTHTPATESSASLEYPRPPFVLGISGNLDPIGYADDPQICWSDPRMLALRSKIINILEWIQLKDNRLEPSSGALLYVGPESESTDNPGGESWHSLGLANTPILVLSSLAPGVDTIVAEVVLEYAETHPHVSLAAPLGFPADIYARSSSFGGDPAKIARYNSLVERIKGQAIPRPVFGVALDNDLMPSGETEDEAAEKDLERTDPTFGNKPRRYLRYRAAGEFIAVHSDLLLAIHDDECDRYLANSEGKPSGLGIQSRPDLFDAGTAAIVEAKRSGLSHELLAVSNNFAWADNGPVLVLPILRKKREKLPLDSQPKSAQPGPLRFLHPYDLCPEGVDESDDQHPFWQKTGNQRFRRVLARQEQFNELRAHPKEKDALVGLIGNMPTNQDARAFAAKLDGIARVRRRAATEGVRLDRLRGKLLVRMFILIFFAASFFGAYEHWHHEGAKHHAHHPSPVLPVDLPAWTQVGLLALAFGCLLSSALLYYRHRKSGNEENRFDYRAIGEALRVQFYWHLAGTGRSVAADYMQRQRDELDWIRYVVSSLSMPHETVRRNFLALPLEAQVSLLHVVRDSWVRGQEAYFQKESEKREKAAHTCHARGWTLAATGLLSMIVMFFAELIQPLEDALHHHPLLSTSWAIFVGGTMLGFHFWRSRAKKADAHAPAHEDSVGEPSRRTGFLRWVFGSLPTWGAAILLAAVLISTAFTLGEITTQWPDGHNWWIIFTGAFLLAGGLSIAWAERNFYGEEARQFRAMSQLFGCAGRRLENIIPRYGEAAIEDDQSAEARRLLFEIHDILHQLGCEALDENAEWLIQHRARPLEMLMAG